MACTLCKNTEKPEYFDSDPKCAWEAVYFDSDNWNCVTANRLRDLVDYSFRDDDSSGSIGVIRIPGNDVVQGYVVMSWYKDRGRTSQIWLFNDDDKPRTLHLNEAEEIINIKQKNIKHGVIKKKRVIDKISAISNDWKSYGELDAHYAAEYLKKLIENMKCD